MQEIMILERSRISLHPFQAREKDTTSQARNLRLPDLNLKNLQLIITLKLVLHARQFLFPLLFLQFECPFGYQNYLLKGIYFICSKVKSYSLGIFKLKFFVFFLNKASNIPCIYPD